MFKRGFKAWCENTAASARRQIGVNAYEPLSMPKLAASLGAKILYPEQIQGLDDGSLDVLIRTDKEGWSAVTLTLGPNPIIILNSAHSASRQSSSLAHEVSHLLLGHKPAQTGISPNGFLLTAFDRDQEDEADWLAGCLLLPREACLYLQRLRLDPFTAGRKYGVSQDMLRFRMNTTGVRKQINRWRGRAKVARK